MEAANQPERRVMIDERDFRELRTRMEEHDRAIVRLGTLNDSMERTLIAIEKIVTEQGKILAGAPEITRRVGTIERELKTSVKVTWRLESLANLITPLLIALLIWKITTVP